MKPTVVSKPAKRSRIISSLALLTMSGVVACTPSEQVGGGEEQVGQAQEAISSTKAVLVNQLGYAVNAKKIAVMPTTSSTTQPFKVVNSSGTTVWTSPSNTTYKAADNNSGDAVQLADFSAFTTAGTGYKVVIGTTNESEPLDIGNDVYGTAGLGKAAIKFFNWKRSGIAVAADTTFNINGHNLSHDNDKSLAAYGSTPWRTGTFDVKGGWYDAGDFGKYLESHTAATFYLANLWERYKGVADGGARTIDGLDLGFNDGTLPDYLAEIAWGTRWVRGAMPNPTVHKNTGLVWSDLVANKCTSAGWADWVNYDADTATRYCMGPSTSSTTSAARDMAQVSRLMAQYPTASTIVQFAEDTAPLTAGAYADKLWAGAKEAFGRATGKYPGEADYTGAGKVLSASNLTSDLKMSESPGFNQGSGAYGDDDMWDDEYAAAVELYLTACQRDDATAVAKYKGLVTAHPYYKLAGPCDWGSETALGDPIKEEVGCGLISILTVHDTYCTGTEALPAADIATMKANLSSYADTLVTAIDSQNYPFYVADSASANVPWGSNGAVAGAIVMLTAAYDFGGKNQSYLKNAARLGDYLLGTNPFKGSYVIGFGDAGVGNTHDRAMKATTKWVKGTLVGGPHNRDANFNALATRWGGSNNIDDPLTPDSGPALKRFNDSDDGASTWEWKENAVNWNASLAHAMWGLQVRSKDMTPDVACPTSCDDSNPCTTDSCNNGVCANTNNTAGCDDGNAATCNDACSAGVCVGGGACPTQSPYGGTARALTSTIQAEDYDTGGANVAFNDADATNSGGAYRASDPVDMEATTDANGGYNVGWTAAGEWLEYTTNIATTGTYSLDVRVASTAAGKTMHVEVDGVNKSGTIAVPNTGGWQTFQTVNIPNISLSAKNGAIVRVVFDTDGTNFNWFKFNSSAAAACTPADCNDNNPCTVDTCNNGTCSNVAGNAGTTCRNAGTNSTCDPAETCSGTSTTCPSNAYASSGTACNDGNSGTSNDVCNGSGTCAGTTSCTSPTAPAAPSGTAGNGAVSLSWGAVSGATSYKVYRDTSATGSFATLACSPDPTTASCSAGSLTNGTSYYFKVAAVNSCGTSATSTASGGIAPTSCTSTSAPAAPGAPTTSNSGVGAISVSWTAVSGATGYTIYRSTTSGGTYTSVGTATSTSFTNTGLTGNTTYFYKVMASNCFGNSAQSTASAVTTAYTCSDGVLNGAETGIDCGGAACTACSTGGTEPCTPNLSLDASAANTGNFNTTGAICIKVTRDIAGWGCSNLDGRTLQINDVVKTPGSMPMPAKVNNAYYFEASAGTYAYASCYWW